ncbi:MAG: phenylacetate--CoA ligase family protein [Bryobacterales bacterium]|nr:phenylacetate--CoA ligase family protein [Bryobacterales bacterium]
MISEVLEFVSLLHRRSWPRVRLEEYRRVKLRRLVRHAYDHVPYYRGLMDRAGVTPADVREPADLLRLPVTTKADLRRAGADALARGASDLTVLHTSGHSGVPFEVRLTSAEYRTRRLRDFRMLIGAGVRPRDRLTLLGPTRTRSSRLHRRLGLYRIEVLPGSLPLAEQLERLRASRPDVLWAYPTVLKSLLYYAGCGLGGIVRPRLVITSSQTMEPVFRNQLLVDNPGLEIVDIYGSAEAGRIAATCSSRLGLHLEDDALIVELLEDGRPVPPGRPGSTVLTCLDQFAMPLIRYEQGDLCRLIPGDCPCGRQVPRIAPPLGRRADMVTLPSGRKISCFALDVALRDERALRQYRFVQRSLHSIEAELCFSHTPPPEKLRAVQQLLEAQLEEGMRVDVRLVPEPHFDGLKFKVFVSELAS